MGQLQNMESDIRATITKYANMSANDVHTVLAAIDNDLHIGATALQNGAVNAIHALAFVKGGPAAPKAPPAPPAGATPVWVNPHAIAAKPATPAATVTQPVAAAGAAPAPPAPAAPPANPAPAAASVAAAPAPAPAASPEPAVQAGAGQSKPHFQGSKRSSAISPPTNNAPGTSKT